MVVISQNVVPHNAHPVSNVRLAEALMDTSACRIVPELNGRRTGEALHAAALAVSSAAGEEVFAELSKCLASVLGVDAAFIAECDDNDPDQLQVLAMTLDGQLSAGMRYRLEGTPCATVLKHGFRAYPADLTALFPDDMALADQCAQGYAGAPLCDARGAPLGSIAIVSRQPLRDIEQIESVLRIVAVRAGAEIEQRRALEARRRSEAGYRAIFDAAEDAIVVHDWDTGAVLDANPKARQVFGWPAEGAGSAFDAMGLTVQQHAAERAAHLTALAKTGHCPPFESQRLGLDGSTRWDEVRLKATTVAGRRHVLAFRRDVTALRERERALQRSQARLRATVDAAFDCVIGMDGEGRIVEFNGAAERCFGHRRDDVMGHRLADLILPERHRDAHNRGLAHFHGSGRGPMIGRLVETTALRADGSEFPVELAISVAAVPEGSIFVGHLRDISARRAAEAERGALEAQLRQAQKMEAIGQLTGGLAHDFNNILTSVLGYLVMGRDRAEHLADATLQRQLAQAHAAAQRATDLVAQLMAFARRQPSQRRVLAVAPLVRKSLQLLRATLSAQMALGTSGLESEGDEAPLQVLADGVQLEQVLLNLCINARDAMGTQGRIGVHLRRLPKAEGRCASCGSSLPPLAWAELRVSDTGNGISADVMQRMFEPFYTTKEVGRGTGMGLAMVHGIVHNHQGHILVDSRPGEGSAFRILLPAADTEAPVATGPSNMPSAPRATPSQGRVMLVEDDPQVGEFMAELLSSWGLQVHWLQDPVAAAALITDADAPPDAAFDLLVTDQTMPGMTGLELARIAHASSTAMPVLLYSGNTQAVPEPEWRRAGIHAVLRKPIDPYALRALVDRCLHPAIERSVQAAIGRGISG